MILEAPGTTTWPKRLVAAALPDVRPVRVDDTTVYRLSPSLPLALPAGGPSLPYAPPVHAVCGI